MDIDERWSLLKKAILTDPNVKGTPTGEGYAELFKSLDLNLSSKLSKVSKAAEAAAKKQDPASRALFKQQLIAAAAVLAGYKNQLAFLKNAFLAKYMANASWAMLESNLNKIESDVLATAAALG